MNQQYTREFKIEAVRLSYEPEQTIAQLAKQLGVGKSSLYKWRAKYQAEPEEAFPGKGNLRGKDAEIARLKKELRKAKMENEILKKATAIFAQTSQ